MDLVVRPAAPDELRAAGDVMRIALLHGIAKDDEWERWKFGWEDGSGHLAITGWDGDRCVGHAGSFTVDTVVPGGRWLRTAAVTRVGVLPTHTRQGLLTRMMRRLLEDERADGKVIASLRASEAVIYGRFGFGIAGDAVSVELDPARLRPVRGAAKGGFRLLRVDEVLDVVPPLYARMHHRPGAISRPNLFWQRIFEGLLDRSKGDSVVVHIGVDGVDDGYAHYTLEWDETPGQEPKGKATLHDLFAADPSVELALWSYLLNLSLVRSISADRPVDDLLTRAVPDVRGYVVKERWDEQWVRLLDVEAALAARGYGIGEPVAIAVVDPWFADNEATFLVAPDGVTRTDGPAELTAPIEAISAAYMGAVPFADLAAVGRATEHSPGAAARADVLFAHRGSWTGTFF